MTTKTSKAVQPKKKAATSHAPHRAKAPKRPGLWLSFFRSQFSSFAATLVDFGVLFGMTELLHVWYVVSTATGSFSGALANFLINRYWTFEASAGKAINQVWRYALVSAGSLALNTGGVYLATEYGHVHYAISVGVVSLVVGFAYNFPLHRHFVFR